MLEESGDRYMNNKIGTFTKGLDIQAPIDTSTVGYDDIIGSNKLNLNSKNIPKLKKIKIKGSKPKEINNKSLCRTKLRS
jgi:hypothetical protein